MATLTKKTRARKSWSKGASHRSRRADQRVEYRDAFEISPQEASVLVAAMRQSRELSESLNALVAETGRHCSMQS